MKGQVRVSNLNLVPIPQHTAFHGLAVHEGAVKAALIVEHKALWFAADLRVSPGYLFVAQYDFTTRVASDTQDTSAEAYEAAGVVALAYGHTCTVYGTSANPNPGWLSVQGDGNGHRQGQHQGQRHHPHRAIASCGLCGSPTYRSNGGVVSGALRHIPPQDKLRQLRQLGGRFYVCGPSMDHFGVKKSELVFDDAVVAEYFTFVEVMRSADIHVFLQ